MWQAYYSYEQQQQQHEQSKVVIEGGSKSSSSNSIKSSPNKKNVDGGGCEEEEPRRGGGEYIILRIPNTTVTFRLDFDTEGTCTCYNPYRALDTLPLKNNNDQEDGASDVKTTNNDNYLKGNDNDSSSYADADDDDDDECSSKFSKEEARAALELLYQKHIVSVIDSLNYHTWRVIRCLTNALTVTPSDGEQYGEKGQATNQQQQPQLEDKNNTHQQDNMTRISTTEYLVTEAAMDTFEQQRTMQRSLFNLKYSTVQLTSDSSTSCLDVSGRSGRSSQKGSAQQQQPQSQLPSHHRPSREWEEPPSRPYQDYLDDQWGKREDLDVITPKWSEKAGLDDRITRKHGVITRTETNPQDPVASSSDDRSMTLSIQEEEGDDDIIFEHELAKLHIAPPTLGYKPRSNKKNTTTNNRVTPKSSNLQQTTSSNRHQQKQHQQQQRETFGGGKYGNNVDLELNPNRIANNKKSHNTPNINNSNSNKGVATNKKSSANNNTGTTATRGRNNHHQPQQQRRRAPARLLQRRPSFVPTKDASLFDGKKRRESMKLSGLSIISDPGSSDDESSDDDDSSTRSSQSSNDDNNSMQRPKYKAPPPSSEPLSTSTQLVLYSPEVAAKATTTNRKKNKPHDATTTEFDSPTPWCVPSVHRAAPLR